MLLEKRSAAQRLARVKTVLLAVVILGLSLIVGCLQAESVSTPVVSPAAVEDPEEEQLPADPLPESMKGYAVLPSYENGLWSFTITPGLNAFRPCDDASPAASIGQKVHGLDALKAALGEMKAGEYVTLCYQEGMDDALLEKITNHSQMLGIQLNIAVP